MTRRSIATLMAALATGAVALAVAPASSLTTFSPRAISTAQVGALEAEGPTLALPLGEAFGMTDGRGFQLGAGQSTTSSLPRLHRPGGHRSLLRSTTQGHAALVRVAVGGPRDVGSARLRAPRSGR